MLEGRAGVLGHDTIIGNDQRLAEARQTCRTGSDQANRISISKFGVPKPCGAEIDRSQNIPAGTIVRILRKMPLGFRHQQRHVIAWVRQPRFQRLIGQTWAAQHDVETEPDSRRRDSHDTDRHPA
ncbi:hypothetical protein D3C86_1865510 [compost metagenome]